jgi:hypothetical protein
MKELLQFNSKAKGQETRKAMRKVIQARQTNIYGSHVSQDKRLDHMPASDTFSGLKIAYNPNSNRINNLQPVISERLVTDQALLESNTTRGKMHRLLNDIRRPGILDKIKSKFTIRRT